MSFWGNLLSSGTLAEFLEKQLSGEVVPRQDTPVGESLDTEAIKAELMASDPAYRKQVQAFEAQDAQLARLNSAREAFRETGDRNALADAYLKELKQGFLFSNAVQWEFRTVDALIMAKRYDEAWGILNQMAVTRLAYIERVRKQQIRILKKEKKDYSHIQRLLDSGQ